MPIINNPWEIYLGHSMSFWVEAKRQMLKEGTTDLYQEIADLRSKVSFYESRIKQMKEFMER